MKAGHSVPKAWHHHITAAPQGALSSDAFGCSQGSALLHPQIYPSMPQHSPWARPNTQPSKPWAQSLPNTSYSSRPDRPAPSTPLHPSSVPL